MQVKIKYISLCTEIIIAHSYKTVIIKNKTGMHYTASISNN